MIDELPSREERERPTNEGNATENIVIPKPRTARSYEAKAKQYAQETRRYVGIAISLVRRFLLWCRGVTSASSCMAAATVAIAITTIVYTHYAKKQWQVMDGQLRLTRDQLEGTQAAFISLTVAMDPPYGAVNVYAKNIGHVIASSFTARIVITRMTLPSRKPIGEPIVKVIQPQPVAVGQDPISESYRIPNFGKEEWDAMMRLEQTVFVEYDFSYDNGFEHVTKVSDCKFFLYVNFQARNGQVLGFNQGPWPCGSFDKMFEDAQNLRKTAESEANEQQPASKPN